MNTKTRLVSMLFADLAGYSKIGNERLYSKLQSLAERFHKTLEENDLLYYNTWGDAFFICADDPLTLLEIALNLRDWYRNQNWTRHGFPKALPIRIALHIEKATIHYKDGIVSNVIGQHVTATARIEPVVEHDSVYCKEIDPDTSSALKHMEC